MKFANCLIKRATVSIFAVASAAIVLSAGTAHSQEGNIVEQVWERYLQTCNDLALKPNSALDSFPVDEPDSVLAYSDGNTRVVYGWSSNDYKKSSSVEMAFTNQGASNICSVNRYFDSIASAENAQLLKALAEENGYTINGGLLNFVKGSEKNIRNYTSGVESYSFNIEGVFANPAIITIVDIRDSGVTIFFSHFHPR